MCKATLQWRRAVYVAHINSFINSYCHEVYYVCIAAANSPAEHLVCCVLCMFHYSTKANTFRQCTQHCSIVGWDWVQYCTQCPAEHLVCCVLCMFPQFSKDKCKPVTETCRTPRYLGMEMFNLVYNHPPPPPLKYHNITKTIIHIMLCGCATYVGTCKCTESVSLRVWNWDVNYTHYSTSRVAALALQALTALLAHTLASFPGLVQLWLSAVHGAVL